MKCNLLFKLKPPVFWQKKNIISYFLYPISLIYILIIKIRRIYYYCYNFAFFTKNKFSVPVIIIGNITVGGTGKTPLTIYLADFFKNKGYRPGIVSRGYGGKSKKYPILITEESKVTEVGDEALLIARRTKCPVVVDPNRNNAIKKILSIHDCNIIISDDGLQHYAMRRDIEVVVVDAQFGFGNGFCLPAGPLREPLGRLQKVDLIIKKYNKNINLASNKYAMFLEPIALYNIKNPIVTMTIDEFIHSDIVKNKIHAVAGIGNPLGFFSTLRFLGLKNIIEHSFGDHYVYNSTDLLFDEGIVIMTEKDAVKCDSIANNNCWCLKVEAKLNNNIIINKIGDVYGRTSKKY